MDIMYQMGFVLQTYVTTTASYVNKQIMEHHNVFIVDLDLATTLQEFVCHVFQTVEYALVHKWLFVYNVDLDSSLIALINAPHVLLTQNTVSHAQI